MLRNLASSLFLTERDEEVDELGREYADFGSPNKPKVTGRIVTTLAKAKEVRPLVEKCITIAKKALKSEEEADQFSTGADRNSEEWKQWRNSEEWQQWNQAIAPSVAARRRCIQLLGNKFAVEILFDKIAERFVDRDGGYTRILRLASARLGDAGPQAILELVGTHERKKQKSERPAFEDDEVVDETPAEDEAPSDETDDTPADDVQATAGEDQPAPEDDQSPDDDQKKDE
jgi:large subunit ribosomal protein L17